MQKYVDIDGLRAFKNELEEKFSTQNTDTATTSSNGLMSAADKAKLDGIESNAQVNVIETIKVNGTPLVPDENKAVNITGAGGGGGLNPVIQVTCESSDITVTKSGVNYPATSHNGNIHIFPVDDYGTYDITATATVFGVTVTRTTTVDVIDYNALKIFTANINFRRRYGYRIKKTEADPYERVEYLYDAVGMTPAHMDFDNGVFDYGDWGGIWFVQDNKPLMLKSDGTVDYYLNPNDYTLKENGELSDVANIDYDGNAMAQFPLCWVYRYEDDKYLYEIVSNVQYDENYKAYAHTDASGNIKDYFYLGLFRASNISSKLRSIKGQALFQAPTLPNAFTYSTANGSGWHIKTWSQYCLVNTLLVLIGKSTDPPSIFGYGNMNNDVPFISGASYDKGQFYGYNSDYTHQVKTFHAESFWGDELDRLAGIFKYNDKIYVKMTPEGQGYFADAVTGYTNTGITPVTTDGIFITGMSCNEYGLIPTAASGGSGSTYFCDTVGYRNITLTDLYVGGQGAIIYNTPLIYGPFFMAFYRSPTETHYFMGCSLSYV